MSGEASKSIPTKELWEGGRSPFSVSYGKMMMWFFLISDALTFGGLLVSLGFAKHRFETNAMMGEMAWPVSEDVFWHFPFTHAFLPLMYVAFMTFILIVSSVTMVLAVEAGHRMDRKGVTKWLAYTVIGGAIFLGSQVWEWAAFINGSEYGSYRMATGEMYTLVDLNAEHHGDDHDAVAPVAEDEHDEHADDHGDDGHHHDGDLEHGHKKAMEWNDPLEINGDQKWALQVTRDSIIDNPAIVAEIMANNEHVKGANLSRNEYGHTLYANFFFFITGFHGTHVLSGVVINLIILIGVMKGTYHGRGHYEMVEKVGLYWHFIDLVWVFVFTFFYLI